MMGILITHGGNMFNPRIKGYKWTLLYSHYLNIIISITFLYNFILISIIMAVLKCPKVMEYNWTNICYMIGKKLP